MLLAHKASLAKLITLNIPAESYMIFNYIPLKIRHIEKRPK